MEVTNVTNAPAELVTNSIELTRNAKQEYHWAVKVRWPIDAPDQDAAKIGAQAMVDSIDLHLRQKYHPEEL